MKVKITPIELKNQIPTKVHDCYYRLHDDCIEHKYAFAAKESITRDEPELGMEEVENYFHCFAKKEQIVAIELIFTDLKNWKLLIFVNGLPDDMIMYFKTLTEAKEHFNRILEWWRPAK